MIDTQDTSRPGEVKGITYWGLEVDKTRRIDYPDN